MDTVKSTLAGAVIGAVLAAMAKGALMGIEQMDSGFGWLSIPIDAISAPVLVVVDLMMLGAPGGVHHLVVLPWAAAGFVLGAVVGYRSARPAASTRNPGPQHTTD